jgi:hypothetical protein
MYFTAYNGIYYSVTPCNITINIAPINQPPVATTLNLNANEVPAGATVANGLTVPLAGTDVDGSVVSFTITSYPAVGSLYVDGVLQSSGSVPFTMASTSTLVYLPTAYSLTAVSFLYTCTDNGSPLPAKTSLAAATVTIAINLLMFPPQAQLAVNPVVIVKNSIATFTLGGYDPNGANGQALHIVITGINCPNCTNGGFLTHTQAGNNFAANATVKIGDSQNLGINPGTIGLRYVHKPQEWGTYNAFVTFMVVGANGMTSANTSLTLQITNYNTPPTAWVQNNNITMLEDGSINITLSGGDVDWPGDTLQLQITVPPSQGSLTYLSTPLTTSNQYLPSLTGVFNISAVVVFKPTVLFWGTPYSTFSFVTYDQTTTSTPVTVTINVLHINHPPAATAIATQSATCGVTLSFTIAGTDPDTIDTLTFSFQGMTNLKGQVWNGGSQVTNSYTYNSGSAAVRSLTLNYTIPCNGQYGTQLDTFNFTVTDNYGANSTAVVVVFNVNPDFQTPSLSYTPSTVNVYEESFVIINITGAVTHSYPVSLEIFSTPQVLTGSAPAGSLFATFPNMTCNTASPLSASQVLTSSGYSGYLVCFQTAKGMPLIAYGAGTQSFVAEVFITASSSFSKTVTIPINVLLMNFPPKASATPSATVSQTAGATVQTLTFTLLGTHRSPQPGSDCQCFIHAYSRCVQTKRRCSFTWQFAVDDKRWLKHLDCYLGRAGICHCQSLHNVQPHRVEWTIHFNGPVLRCVNLHQLPTCCVWAICIRFCCRRWQCEHHHQRH